MSGIAAEILTEIETITCEHCGCEAEPDDVFEVSGQILCNDCYYNETSTCSDCGNRIFDDESVGDDTTLCQRCYDNRYTRCEACGTLLNYDDTHREDDDDYDYCYDCYTKRAKSRAIHDYSYKPEPIFYGDGNRFFGIELEIDGAGEDSGNAENLLNIANQSCDHIYCKHDGSLDDGFELVSYPMTLDYHCDNMPWRGVLNMALDLSPTIRLSSWGTHASLRRAMKRKTATTTHFSAMPVICPLPLHITVCCTTINHCARA